MNHIIIGLDKADEKDVKFAFNFFCKLKLPFSILWNDGPNLKKLDAELQNKGLAPKEMGKGRNVWYCIGMAIARGEARSIALHDCDIKLMTDDYWLNYFIQLLIHYLILSFAKDIILVLQTIK